MKTPVTTGLESKAEAGDLACGRAPAGRGAPGKLRFFTIADVADILSLSPRSVRRLIDDGKLPAHRFGHAVRVAEGDLRAFIARHRD